MKLSFSLSLPRKEDFRCCVVFFSFVFETSQKQTRFFKAALKFFFILSETETVLGVERKKKRFWERWNNAFNKDSDKTASEGMQKIKNEWNRGPERNPCRKKNRKKH